MNEHYLTIWDLVLTPLYLIVLTLWAKKIRDLHYPVGHPLRRYYLPGLLVKFAGAIFIAVIYHYYYKSGDTLQYFDHSRIINSSLSDSFETWVKLLVRVSPESDPHVYRYSSQLYWYSDTPSYTVASIGAVFGLLNGTTYLPIALLFAFVSFTGIWAMFKTFAGIYPSYHKQLAIAFLFIPTTFVWGSGLFKDTVCMFALGWMTYAVFGIFINKRLSVKNIFFLCLGFYLLAIVKVYILVAFVPALSIWLLMSYLKKIPSKAVRRLMSACVISICLAGLVLLSQNLSKELGRYSLDNLATTAIITQDYINRVSETGGGSGYDLGSFEPTLIGMMSKFPQAVVVTLFRPFLWEIKKPIMLLSALESLFFGLLIISTVYKRGIRQSIAFVTKDPTLLFFLIYSLIFAFAVGISTGNFGTLSRYKIPCMPFFAAFLLILFSGTSSLVKRKKKARLPLQRTTAATGPS